MLVHLPVSGRWLAPHMSMLERGRDCQMAGLMLALLKEGGAITSQTKSGVVSAYEVEGCI